MGKLSYHNPQSPLSTSLKVPCHAFPVITRPLVCYEGFSACERSAESQTLKVHPVASKTLTQKRPVYAAPERLVGHFLFQFSIFFFREPIDVTTTPPWIGPNGTNPWSRYVTSAEPLC